MAKKKKEPTMLDAIKQTRPRFVAPSQMHHSKKRELLEKAERKTHREEKAGLRAGLF